MVMGESEVFLPGAKHELETRPSQGIGCLPFVQECVPISPSRETRTKKVPTVFEWLSPFASARRACPYSPRATTASAAAAAPLATVRLNLDSKAVQISS